MDNVAVIGPFVAFKQWVRRNQLTLGGSNTFNVAQNLLRCGDTNYYWVDTTRRGLGVTFDTYIELDGAEPVTLTFKGGVVTTTKGNIPPAVQEALNKEEKTQPEAQTSSSTPEFDQMCDIARHPVWDGNLISKTVRDKLVKDGLVFQFRGWNAVTEAGLAAAIAFGMVKA